MSQTVTSLPAVDLGTRNASACQADAIDSSFRPVLLAVLGLGALWLIVGSILTLIASIKFHGPNFLADQAWLTYGRVRPPERMPWSMDFVCQPAWGWRCGCSGGLERPCSPRAR
jgi:hypothetical protein